MSSADTQEFITRPIQTVERLSARDQASIHRSVYCPLRKESVPFAQCRSCERLESAHVDIDPRKSFVRCDVPQPEAPPRPRWLTPPGIGSRVGEIMSASVTCLDANMPFDEAVMALVEKQVGGMPVMDDDRRPIGMLSKTDCLLRRYEELEDEDDDNAFEGTALSVKPPSVREVMTPYTLSVREETPVSEAAAVMAFEGVHRVAVVDAAGRLVGILSAIDVLGWLARECGFAVPRTIARRSR